MARFNEILVGRFNRGLQKLLSIKGEAVSPQLATEIIPVLPLPLGDEYRYLDSWAQFARMIGIAAGGAATQAALMLRNPVGSNVMAVVTKAIFNNGAAGGDTAQLFHAGGNLADLANNLSVVGGAERFDARGPVVPASHLSWGVPNGQFSGGILILSFNLVQGTSIELLNRHEVVLAPGDTIEIIDATANTACTLGLWWRERYLEESERA